MFISSTPVASTPIQSHRSTAGQIGEDGVYPTTPKTYTHNQSTGDLTIGGGATIIRGFQLDGIATAIEVARFIDFSQSTDIDSTVVAGQTTPTVVPEIIVDYIETAGVLTSIKVGSVTYTWPEAYSLAGYIRSCGIGTPYAP